MKKIIEKIKHITVVIFLILFSLLVFFPNFNKKFINIFIMDIQFHWLYGYLLNWIIAWVLHKVAFRSVNYNLKKKNKQMSLHEKVLGILLTPDFLFASFYKNKLPKCKKAKFIYNSNWLNIILMFNIGSLLLLTQQNLHVPLFLKVFFIFHLISRIVEISYAFYKDIIDVEKNTTIEAHQRIRLAVNSYLEIILLFAVIYFIYSSKSFQNSLLLSGSVSTFTFSSVKYESIKFKYITSIQIFSSLNLVILSIASYIGEKKSRDD